MGVVLSDVVHRPGGKGVDGVPLLPADVHPVVELILPVHRMVPVAVGGAQVAVMGFMVSRAPRDSWSMV